MSCVFSSSAGKETRWSRIRMRLHTWLNSIGILLVFFIFANSLFLLVVLSVYERFAEVVDKVGGNFKRGMLLKKGA